jgi:phosphatidylglycerophosphate synthase
VGKLAALVLDSGSRIRFGGLTAAERAVIGAARAGLSPILVCGSRPFSQDLVRRLLPLNPSLVPLETGRTLDGIPGDAGVLVIGPDVLAEPRAIAMLAGQTDAASGRATVIREAGVPLMMRVPAEEISRIRMAASIDEMADGFAQAGRLEDTSLPEAFCRRLRSRTPVRYLERLYLRRTNGGSHESFFTQIIRRFSVPLSIRLARAGVRPAQVTLAGLALAVASAWCLAQGHYGLGVAGGLLYYASMIMDCSDGEVARLTLRDSAFGAWLETMVDYSTYLFVLGALVIASAATPRADAHLTAAGIALAGSLVVIGVASYLRRRVAGADPGQFDESSARALKSAGRLHRFARWGRQWIKRSTMAHLILALALVGQLTALLYLWAFGATVAAVVILAVSPFVVHHVGPAPAGRPGAGQVA